LLERRGSRGAPDEREGADRRNRDEHPEGGGTGTENTTQDRPSLALTDAIDIGSLSRRTLADTIRAVPPIGYRSGAWGADLNQ
jgi:hypothetical protein